MSKSTTGSVLMTAVATAIAALTRSVALSTVDILAGMGMGATTFGDEDYAAYLNCLLVVSTVPPKPWKP